MQELKYLIDKEIIRREEAFITDIIYPMKNGRADIHLYDVFPGVQLLKVKPVIRMVWSRMSSA